MTLTILDPTGGNVPAGGAELAPRPASLAGRAIGYLDNGKPNSDRVLALTAELLRREGVRDGLHVRKGGVGRLAEPEIVDDLAARCDVVVTGVGDCAGCCSCTVQDAIALERRGVPTFAVVTTELVTTARIAAKSAGMPDYPLIIVPHPLGSLGEDHLAGRADDAVRQVLAALGG